jgi:methylmalonyl-CoA carboxyltransferase large subunit
MVKTAPKELTKAIEDLRKEMAAIADRIARLEMPTAPAPAEPRPAARAAEQPKPEPQPGITEEELLAISGALAAYFGVRVHIRQIRLTGTRAWAQQGRVSIQASHRLHT